MVIHQIIPLNEDTPTRQSNRPFNHASIADYEAKCDEYEEIKALLARWRWEHDPAWMRHVAKYVTLRMELGRSNELLILGSSLDAGYSFSPLGTRVMRDWLCRDF